MAKISYHDVHIPSGKYFISHSYKDIEAREIMIKQLPDGVEPFIFPPISVAPHEFVSNALINAILACDGVIYLNGGFSSKSFWVAFERDYALRAKKPVYRFDISNKLISEHKAYPIDLQVIYSFTHDDKDRVNFIWDYMLKERYFETPWMEPSLGTNLQESMEFNFKHSLEKGAYFVSFCSYKSGEWQYADHNYVASLGYKDRILLAFLDDCRSSILFHGHPDDLRVNLWSNESFSHINRIDDLIVRLYWLMFREQFPALV